MTWQNADPLAAFAGAAGGVATGVLNAKNTEYERHRQAQQDAQAAAEAAAQAAYYRSQEAKTAQDVEIGKGTLADAARARQFESSIDTSRLPTKFSDPQDGVDYYSKLAATAMAAGDKDAATTYQNLANGYASSFGRITAGKYTAGAKTAETNAHTQLYKALSDRTSHWRDQLANQLRIARVRADSALRVEAQRASAMAAANAARISASYGLTQIRGAQAMDRVRALTDARETMSMQAELFALQGKSAQEASAQAGQMYGAQLKQWETQSALQEATNPGATPVAEPTPPGPAMTFNLGQGAQQSPVIVVPLTLPDGHQTQITVPNPHYQSGGAHAGASHHATKKPVAAVPAAPQGNPIMNAITGALSHFFQGQ